MRLLCPLTESDREILQTLRNEKLARIGHLAMRRDRIVAAIAEATKLAKLAADIVTAELRAGEAERECSEVEVELEGLVRIYREDTGELAGVRPMDAQRRLL